MTDMASLRIAASPASATVGRPARAATMERLLVGALVASFYTEIVVASVGPVTVTASKLVAVGVVGAIAFGVGPRCLRASVALALGWGLVLLAYALSAIASGAPGRSVAVVSAIVLNPLIAAFVAGYAITRRRAEFVARMFMLAGAGAAALTLFQSFFHAGYVPGARETDRYVAGAIRLWRGCGLMLDPNYNAQILLVSFAVALFVCRSRWVALLIGLGVLATFSRTGLAGLICAGGYCSFQMVRRRGLRVRVPIVLMAACLGAFVAALPELRSHLLRLVDPGSYSTSSAGSIGERVMLLRASWQATLEAPALGHGPGAGADVLKETIGRRAVSHNTFLEVATEAGLVGLAAFGVLLWLSFVTVMKGAAVLRRCGRRNLADALAGAWLVFFATCFLLVSQYHKLLWIWPALAFAAARGAVQDSGISDDPAGAAGGGTP